MAWLAILLLGLVPEGETGGLEIRLRREVAVANEPLRLRDVAEIEGPAGEVNRIADLELGGLPRPGYTRQVTPVAILLAARRVGIDLQREQIVGALEVLVEGDWARVATSKVVEEARAFVRRELRGSSGRSELQFDLSPPPLVLPSQIRTPPLKVVWEGAARGPGPIRVRVQAMRGDEVVGDTVVTGRIRRYVTALRLLKDVRRGEPIPRNAVSTTEIEWKPGTEAPIASVADLGSEVVRRSLTAGHLLHPSDMLAAPACEKGQEIKLVLTSGQLEVVVIGKALRAGRVGETIPVLNPASQREIRATLIGVDARGFPRARVQ